MATLSPAILDELRDELPAHLTHLVRLDTLPAPLGGHCEFCTHQPDQDRNDPHEPEVADAELQVRYTVSSGLRCITDVCGPCLHDELQWAVRWCGAREVTVLAPAEAVAA